MRTPLIAGNWKMHKTVREAEQFIAALLPRVHAVERTERLAAHDRLLGHFRPLSGLVERFIHKGVE